MEMVASEPPCAAAVRARLPLRTTAVARALARSATTGLFIKIPFLLCARVCAGRRVGGTSSIVEPEDQGPARLPGIGHPSRNAPRHGRPAFRLRRSVEGVHSNDTDVVNEGV